MNIAVSCALVNYECRPRLDILNKHQQRAGSKARRAGPKHSTVYNRPSRKKQARLQLYCKPIFLHCRCSQTMDNRRVVSPPTSIRQLRKAAIECWLFDGPENVPVTEGENNGTDKISSVSSNHEDAWITGCVSNLDLVFQSVFISFR